MSLVIIGSSQSTMLKARTTGDKTLSWRLDLSKILFVFFQFGFPGVIITKNIYDN